MTTTAAHLAQAMTHACTLPSEAMPAQADPPVTADRMRLLALEEPIIKLELLWALLEPYLNDQLEDRTGPFDFVLLRHMPEDEARQFRVLDARAAEVIDYYLREVGSFIRAIGEANSLVAANDNSVTAEAA